MFGNQFPKQHQAIYLSRNPRHLLALALNPGEPGGHPLLASASYIVSTRSAASIATSPSAATNTKITRAFSVLIFLRLFQKL